MNTLINNIIKSLALPNTLLGDTLVKKLFEHNYKLPENVKKKYEKFFNPNNNIENDNNKSLNTKCKYLTREELLDYIQSYQQENSNNKSGFYHEFYNFIKTNIDWTDDSIVDLVISEVRKSKYSVSNLFKIISNQNISFNIIHKYCKELDWYEISSNRNLKWTKDFLNEYYDKVYWDVLSSKSNLSNDILYHFQDKINWKSLSCNNNQIFTNDIIEIFYKSFNMHCIIKNQNLSLSGELFRKVVDYYNSNYCGFWEETSEKFSSWSDNIFINNLDKWFYVILFSNEHFITKIVFPNLDNNFVLRLLNQHDYENYNKSILDFKDVMALADNEFCFFGSYVLKYGKYKDKSINYIIENDLNYLLDLLINSKRFSIDFWLFSHIGEKYVYKPFSTYIYKYEQASRTKASLDPRWDYYYYQEAEYQNEQRINNSFNNSCDEQFYKDFDGQFHEDML